MASAEISARPRRHVSPDPLPSDAEAEAAQRQALLESRLEACERRLAEHDARLEGVPSMEQLMGSVDELLGNTMDGIDRRLSEQVQSIQSLKVTVSRTDDLLERVLESIDSLQSAGPAR